MIKDPEQLEKIKEFFRQRYKLVKDAYKYIACQNPVGDVWALQTSSFLDFVNKLNLLDSKIH